MNRADVRRYAARLLRPFTGGVGAILCLHRVLPDELRSAQLIPRDLELSTGFLETLLDRLRSERYQLVSLHDALQRLQAPKALANGRRVLAITLDDGYRDNLEHALPLFEKFEVPFTVYLTSGLIDRDVDPWWYSLQQLVSQSASVAVRSGGALKQIDCSTTKGERICYQALYREVRGAESENELQSILLDIWKSNRIDSRPSLDGLMMDWSDVRSLAASPLVTIGAHTINHPRLSWLTTERIVAELEGSRTRIEAELEQPVHHLAYPHGSERDMPLGISELAKAAGFDSAVTTIPRPLTAGDRETMWTLPRIAVSGGSENIETCMSSISGFDGNWNPPLRRRLRRTRGFR